MFFFLNDTATTEIYPLSLHAALPILRSPGGRTGPWPGRLSASPLGRVRSRRAAGPSQDRKSTRLNSSHSQISYAVFCLKKTTNLAWGAEPFHSPASTYNSGV